MDNSEKTYLYSLLVSLIVAVTVWFIWYTVFRSPKKCDSEKNDCTIEISHTVAGALFWMCALIIRKVFVGQNLFYKDKGMSKTIVEAFVGGFVGALFSIVGRIVLKIRSEESVFIGEWKGVTLRI